MGHTCKKHHKEEWDIMGKQLGGRNRGSTHKSFNQDTTEGIPLRENPRPHPIRSSASADQRPTKKTESYRHQDIYNRESTGLRKRSHNCKPGETRCPIRNGQTPCQRCPHASPHPTFRHDGHRSNRESRQLQRTLGEESAGESVPTVNKQARKAKEEKKRRRRGRASKQEEKRRSTGGQEKKG